MDRSNFVWDEFSWKTMVRVGPGGRPAVHISGSPSSAASDPTATPVPLHYAPEGRDDQPLDDAEIASVAWTVDNLPVLWDALQPTVFAYYQSICADPDGLDPEDLPAVGSTEDLLPLISIQCMYVHQVSKDGQPYVGFEFECPWNEEHGLGILMHSTRVVEIGAADTAILLWIDRQDSERSQDSAPPQIR
jgi:hypothetical protein